MKQIPNYPNYSITKTGEVWNTKKTKLMAQFDNGRGYLSVSLSNGRTKSCAIHVLLAKAYVPNPNNFIEVRHLNDIKYDNRLENLAWGTRKMNAEDMVANGGSCVGTRNKASKLTEANVIEIRSRTYYRGLFRDLAKEFSVDYTLISPIYHKKTWKHI